MIDYEEFKRLYHAGEREPEFYIIFKNRHCDYMIIKYEDGPTFQRCGDLESRGGEIKYNTLDELFYSDTIDGINLYRDWNEIDYIYPAGYGTFEEYCFVFHIEYKGE